MNRRRILLCDDGATERRIFPASISRKWKKMFPSEDIEVAAYEDIVPDDRASVSRIGISQVGRFECVLLDIMWGMGSGLVPHGVQIARDIRARYPELPIVVFSQNVTLTDFQELIPLGVSAYITKTAKDAAGWCAAIHGALTKAYEDRSGQPLYQELRRLLAERDNAWCKKEVSEAASEVWRHDNAFAKWQAFWTPWIQAIGRMRLALPFNKMKQFFADDELFTLSVLPSMRGHLEHVLHVYFTGYIISHSVPAFREAVMRAVHNLLGSQYQERSQDAYWDLFQFAWLATATLHDIAYPLEVLPDVPKRCGSVMSAFSFAETHGDLPTWVALKYDWTNEIGLSALAGFKYVFGRLYDSESLSDFICDNVHFKGRDGLQRFNHGVASGAMFIGEAKKWTSLPGVPAELERFLCWSGTAMALHALKHASSRSSVRIELKRDPLAFLLALCDELQVWNRSRPDDTANTASFRRVDLIKLTVEDGRLDATVEYTPYTGIDSDRLTEIVRTLTSSLNSDQQLLHRYLNPAPLKIEVHSRIRGVADELATVLLDSRE